MSCGKQLRLIRCANKLTQQQVADALGIERSTYCGYEIGRRNADTEILTKLSHFYKISVNFFFDTAYAESVGEKDQYEDSCEIRYLSQLSKKEIDLIAKYRIMTNDDKKEILALAESKVKSKE